MKHTIEYLNQVCTQVRRDILRMVYFAQSGHPGGSLGCVELFVALYWESMSYKYPKFQMEGTNEDIFFLSNGHISPVWYSCLARRGFFEIAELSTFRKINSRLQGHPAVKGHVPGKGNLQGIRIASGSLGQGLSVAIGAALSKKMNSDVHSVYVLMGDGEQQEGQVWEAAMFAAHHKVDNLIAIVDCNGQQIDGTISDVMSLGSLKAKWEAFGWRTLEFDGNDLELTLRTLQKAKQQTQDNVPIVLLMKTEMGKGVEFMEGSHKWHGIAPNEEQLNLALEGLPETELKDFPL